MAWDLEVTRSNLGPNNISFKMTFLEFNPEFCDLITNFVKYYRNHTMFDRMERKMNGRKIEGKENRNDRKKKCFSFVLFGLYEGRRM